MRLRQDNSLFKLLTTLFFAAITWSVALSANAAEPAEASAKKVEERIAEYEVKNGDTLGAIAIEQGINLEELMKLNEIDDADKVWAGRKLRMPEVSEKPKKAKPSVTIEVPRGFNLSRIAAAYKIPVATIIQANKLTNPDHLREGQKLRIPGVSKVVVLVPPPPCYKDPVTLYRVRSDETQIVPLSFCNGKTSPAGLAVLSKLAGPVKKEMPFPLHPRLAHLLQKISDKYPGKRIEIVSGQRSPKQKGHESYHNKGQAIDFRVEGISNKKLTAFVRTLKNVGVGYYPNSVFIHMDTREKRAYWVDYSGPGERSIYARSGMSEKAINKIRAKRQKKKTEKKVEKKTASLDEEVHSKVSALIHSLASNTKTDPQI